MALADQDLAKAVTALKRPRGDNNRLLMYRNGKDWRPLDAQDVNERLHELVGDEFTAKDLRDRKSVV